MSASVSFIQFYHGLCQFYPKMVALYPHIWFSQRCDLYTLTQHSQLLSQVKVDRVYKRKSQKVQPVDLSLSDDCKPNRSDIWRLDAIKRETPIFDLTNKYIY